MAAASAVPTTPHRRLSRRVHQNRTAADDAVGQPRPTAPAGTEDGQQQQEQQRGRSAEAAFGAYFAELDASFRTLAANVDRLCSLGDALGEFNASFSALLTGMQFGNAAVEFPEAPVKESFDRVQSKYHVRRLPGNNSMPSRMPQRVSTTAAAGAAPQNAAAKPRPLAVNSAAANAAQAAPSRPIPASQPAADARPRAKAAPPANKNGNAKRRNLAFVKKIVDALPLKYRDDPHREVIESVLKALREAPDGLYMQDVDKLTGIGVPKTRCTEYLNVLVHSKHVVRVSRRGLVFQLDPIMYPPLR